MVICTYYQQGRCKFGDRCKYEHPGSQSAFGTGNRFGVLGGGGGTGRGGGSLASRVAGPGGGQDPREKYGLKAADIKNDLTAGEGRPLWVFSAYGPGKNPPVQLFGGPEREQSPEEMRALHYAAEAAGNPQQAVQNANDLYAATEAQIRMVLDDVEGAIKYVIDGENQHPNRNDIVEGNTFTSTSAPATAPAPAPFGQQQQQQQPSSQFGQPGGGQTQSPAFGQPSSFGQQAQGRAGTPALGQPSALGQQKPAFGQPAFGQASQQPAFGKPAMLGQPQSAFGKPSDPGAGQPAFGQPSAMGTSPFAQPSAQGSTQQNPFAAAQTSSSAFGQMGSQTQQSPFSQLQPQQQQPSQAQGQAQQPSPFGQTGQQPAQPSPFAQQQQSQGAGPFGQMGKDTAQPSGFSSTTSAPFGQPSAPTLGTTAQGATPQAQQQQQPHQQQQQAPQITTTSSTRVTNRDPSALNPFPNISGETRREPPSNSLTMWKGRPVKYVKGEPCYQHPDDSETFVHIYFPDGPPDAANFKDAVGTPEEYTAEIENVYRYVKEQGVFKDGLIPSVPPKPEWCSFDF